MRAALPRLLLVVFVLALVPACGDDDGSPSTVDAASNVDGAAAADGPAADAAGIDAASACTSLSLHDCRLDPACAADVCPGCGCARSFLGCRAATATPEECPILECVTAQCCGADGTCEVPASGCRAPDEPADCGTCIPIDPGDCSEDGDCAAGSICEPVVCACSPASQCVAGCASAGDCEAWQSCSGGDHPRCQPKPCGSSADCPADFECGATELCTRKSCTKDEDCDGFCVEEKCYGGGYGTCVPPGV